MMERFSVAVAFRLLTGGTFSMTFFGKTKEEAKFNAETFCNNHPNMKRVI